MDRKRIMIASDLVRAGLAAGFILAVRFPSPWLLYLFSGLLMFASPFFTSGRSSILPTIASREELHTANSLTQTTAWATLTVGALFAGVSVTRLGHSGAFALNAVSFLCSAWAISGLRAPAGGFKAIRTAISESDVVKPWRDYVAGLRYIWGVPLLFAISMVGVGWASGGGAAQILFTLFGEVVFERGAAGIGEVWSCAGLGLLIGAAIGHWFGKRASFTAYKRAIAVCYVIHGGAYVLFSQAQHYWMALVFIALSRAAVAVSSVMNVTQVLRHTADEYRGRVFATNESLVWATMMLSMTAAGLASQSHSPRLIGAWSGVLSSTTAIIWAVLNWRGLPEPKRDGVDPDDIEVRDTSAV
jgi:predicted MFS family arabinose efflux permease